MRGHVRRAAIFLVIPLVLLIVSGCVALPFFKIEVIQTRVSAGGLFAGNLITFRALINDADSYNWDFGDGGTGTGQVVAHLFVIEGIYTVTLEIVRDGKTLTSTKEIRIEFFEAFPFDLLIDGTGSGIVTSARAINCTLTNGVTSGTCQEEYINQTTAALTATPATDFVFESWTNCSSPSGSTCNHTVTSDVTISANFLETFTLEVQLTGGVSRVFSDDGRIDCPGTCVATYTDGTSVTLEMEHCGGCTPFWEGNSGGADVPCIGNRLGPDFGNPIVTTMNRDRICIGGVIL